MKLLPERGFVATPQIWEERLQRWGAPWRRARSSVAAGLSRVWEGSAWQRRAAARRQSARRLHEAAGFWDANRTNAPEYWMSHPAARAVINRRISGDPNIWPMDWFAGRYRRQPPFPLGLSIGCGRGELERDVLGKNICARMEGLDASEESLATARAEASAAGLEERIVYRAGDFNRLRLPRRRYDIVFFQAALHHVENLEGLLDEVGRALVPGGLVYLDEYVGPSRTHWSDSELALARALLLEVPAGLRARDELPPPIQVDDPSEAVRSDEILAAVAARFEIVERRDYGGQLLSLIADALVPEALASPAGEMLFARLLDLEDALLEGGWGRSYFTVVVARARS